MRYKFLFLLLLAGPALQAQVNPKISTKTTSPLSSQGSVQQSLQSTGSYQARGSQGNMEIADPTINALNRQGYNSGLKLYGSNSVLGLPKGTYGFNNGQLWLRSTDATSTGGSSGVGTVGTGGSTSGAGAGGSVPGVNGKNPYAGPTIWGSAQGLNLQKQPLRPSTPAGLPKQ